MFVASIYHVCLGYGNLRLGIPLEDKIDNRFECHLRAPGSTIELQFLQRSGYQGTVLSTFGTMSPDINQPDLHIKTSVETGLE